LTSRTDDTDHGAILRANMDRILAERGLRVVDFCELASITWQQYGRAFKGEGGPQMKTIKHWADTLGVDMSELTKETT
jgi:DNA-binding phage protein